MAKYVIFIKVDTETAVDDETPVFSWDVRTFLGTAETGGDITEKAGPSLISGTSPTVAAAQAEAQAWANTFAQETVYVYKTPDA